MSLLEIKQEVQRLNARQRADLQAFLIKLRHDTPAWKRHAARVSREMKSGKAIPLAEVERRLARG